MSINVAVSGAAGQIGYSLICRICHGDAFGCNQPINLRLLEIEACLPKVNGVVMELVDSAYPLLENVTVTADPEVAFKDADYCVLVGGFPRLAGMDRADLLQKNKAIFEIQGKAIEKVAKNDVRVLVVANPANTNAMILSLNAPKVAANHINSMMRLDHNRTIGQIAQKLNVLPSAIHNVCVFGNHANTMVPVVDNAYVVIDGAKKAVREAVNDDEWIAKTMVPCVRSRGSAIIAARGSSSAQSAASAAIDHLRSWHLGTPEGEYVSVAMMTEKDNIYGIHEGICYSVPCKSVNREWVPVKIDVTEEVHAAIKVSEDDLVKEKAMALN